MMLIMNPEWKEYLRRCNEKKQDPSIQGFIRWKSSRENGLRTWNNNITIEDRNVEKHPTR